MRTLPIFLAAAVAAAIPALSARTADANPYRYQPQNKLAEVSADPRDGRDVIPLPAGDFEYLELRAQAAPIFLRDVAIEFADGRVMHTGSRGVVIPGQGREVDLPRNHAPIVAIVTDYGPQRWNRTPARLEVFGVPCNETPSYGYDVSPYHQRFDDRFEGRVVWRSR
jgi:hypothetical protein